MNAKLEYIIWEEKFSVKHELLDRQHQIILGLINELYHSLQSRESDVSISSVLRKMYDYTHEHFLAEESIMIATNYPGLEEQKQQHAVMVSKNRKITEEFHIYGEAEKLEILKFLKNWWQVHITGLDRKYMPWLLKKKVLKLEI